MPRRCMDGAVLPPSTTAFMVRYASCLAVMPRPVRSQERLGPPPGVSASAPYAFMTSAGTCAPGSGRDLLAGSRTRRCCSHLAGHHAGDADLQGDVARLGDLQGHGHLLPQDTEQRPRLGGIPAQPRLGLGGPRWPGPLLGRSGGRPLPGLLVGRSWRARPQQRSLALSQRHIQHLRGRGAARRGLGRGRRAGHAAGSPAGSPPPRSGRPWLGRVKCWGWQGGNACSAP